MEKKTDGILVRKWKGIYPLVCTTCKLIQFMKVSAVIWFSSKEQQYNFSAIDEFNSKVATNHADPDNVLYQFDQTTERIGLKVLKELKCAQEVH